MRIIKTWLIMAVVFAMAGCSPLSPPSTTDLPGNAAATPSLDPPTVPTAEPPDDLTIRLWLPPFLAAEQDNPASLLLADRLDSFSQQRPDIQVEVRVKAERGPGGLLETMQAASAVAPETLPDFVALDPTGLYTAALKGLVLPLNDVLDQPQDEEWYRFALDGSQIDGEFFGAPFASDGLILAYRSSTYSNAPLAWDLLIAADQTFLLPAGDPEALYTLAQYIHSGGALTTEEGRPLLEADILAAILTDYRDALEQGVLSDQTLSYQTAEETWQALLNGSSQSAVSPLSSFLELDTGQGLSASPLPTGDGQGMGISETWSWAVVTSDPFRQAAVRDLITWLSEPDFLGPWTESMALLPATRPALERWSDNSAIPIATLLAGSFQGRPSEEDIATLGPPIQAAVEAVLSGSMSPQAAALQASQEVLSP